MKHVVSAKCYHYTESSQAWFILRIQDNKVLSHEHNNRVERLK